MYEYHLGHLIRRAQQLHLALWAREVSTTVSSVQFAALTALEQQPGMSQAELGTVLDLDRSTIAGLAERMGRNGLVRRTVSGQDRRRKILALTDSGHETLRTLRPRVDRVEEILLESLDSTGEATLRASLTGMLQHAVDTGVLRHMAGPTKKVTPA